MTVNVAVIYYSATGTVHALAQAVAEGAASTGAEVRLRRVAELAPEGAIDQNPLWRQHVDAVAGSVSEASLDDLVWADAYAFGTPTRFGVPSAQLKQFIDQAGGLWQDGTLADKPVTAFTSAFNRHGGNEATILSLGNVFYHWGSLIVPPGFTDRPSSRRAATRTVRRRSDRRARPDPPARPWTPRATKAGGWRRSRSGCWGAAASPIPPRATGTAAQPGPQEPPRPRERRVSPGEVMTSISTATHRARPHAGPAWMVLALACACQFMVILDAAIVNVALPSIDRDLGFTATGLAWVVNGYLLTFAGLMLLGGRAADLFGHRRTLAAGLFVFSASSLTGGLATASEVLVAARVTQGMGAAMLAPATLAVINTNFTEQHARARAFGAWSAAGGVGGMAGALAGGALTTGLSWRWVFLINVPIGTLLIAVAMISLAGTRTGRRESLDLTGAVTATAGLAALIYGVMQSADHGWASAQVVAPALAGLLLLVVFTVFEARFATQPMIPLRLFRIRGVAVGNGMLLLFGAIAIAMWYFTSLFLQNVLGYSALGAGLGQTPAAVTFMVIARMAAALLPRTGVRPLLLAGGCFLAGFGWLAQAHADSGYLTSLLGPTLLIAVGIGLTFPTLMAAATADVPQGDAGIVGGLANTASQVGGSVGLAVLATAASARAGMDAGGRSPAALATGYDLVFLIAAGLGLAIAAVSLLLPRHRRH
jgi:EmrB/QacA subfamily drug resistance transporter